MLGIGGFGDPGPGSPGLEVPEAGVPRAAVSGVGQTSGFCPLLVCHLCGLLGVPELTGITQGKWLEGEMGVFRVWAPVLRVGSVLAGWAGAEGGSRSE